MDSTFLLPTTPKRKARRTPGKGIDADGDARVQPLTPKRRSNVTLAKADEDDGLTPVKQARKPRARSTASTP